VNILDTKGHTCPTPLIMLKEALLDLRPGEPLQVLTDNETSLKNLLAYLEDQGSQCEVESKDGIHTLLTLAPEESVASTNPAAYCTALEVRDYVVSISRMLMGQGDAELGRILMETFLDHLKMQEQLPTHVVLYNEGVKLAMKELSTCSSLGELEELGVRIVLCGTCIDHYGIQYDIGVGMISNMLSITETLAMAGNVVTP